MNQSWLRKAFLILFLLTFLLLILAPVGSLFQAAAGSQGFFATLMDQVVLATVAATLKQALLSTFLALLMGYPLGLWLASGSRLSRLQLIQKLLSLPFGVPTIVAVTSWIALLGRNGLLAQRGYEIDFLYSWAAVIFVHVFFNIPYVALLVSEATSQIPRIQKERLLTLGAARFKLLRFLYWPKTYAALGAAGLQVFNLCTTSFAIVLILGGGPPVATMETAIYERLRFGALDVAGAAACALWQLLINVIPALIVAQFVLKRAPIRKSGGGHSTAKKSWTFSQGMALLVALCFIIPYASFLFDLQLGDDGLSDLGMDILASGLLSLKLALIASIMAIGFALLGVLTLHGYRHHKHIWHLTHLLSSLPGGVSAFVLGVGIWQIYGEWIDPFSGNLVIIASIQAVLFFPLCFRSFLANLDGFQQRKFEAIQCLGAPPLKAFFIAEWPRWRRPLLVTFSLCLGMSVAEVSAVSLFAGEAGKPLPVLIHQMLGQYRFDEAHVASLALLLLSVGAIVLSSLINTLGAARD